MHPIGKLRVALRQTDTLTLERGQTNGCGVSGETTAFPLLGQSYFVRVL